MWLDGRREGPPPHSFDPPPTQLTSHTNTTQDFDAVEYINAKFASLAAGGSEQLDEALDPFIAQVTTEIGAWI